MTNKEKAAALLDALNIQENAKMNALHWDYPRSEVKQIQDNINRIKDNIISLIKN